MDYPHPLVKLDAAGQPDLSEAYAVGVGEWDKVSIEYGYRDLPKGTDEMQALSNVLLRARERGLTFLTDQDARPQGSAHPLAHLWDNGEDAAAELERVMAVRRAALDRFGESTIRAGAPLATLEEALVPLYLHHRYQTEAAVKLVAGVSYDYALRGDGLTPQQPVPGADQRRALEAVLGTLDPAQLTLPRSILAGIPPRPATFPPHRELFPRHTGLVFDAVAPAVVAADLSVGLLLQPERAARLVEQRGLDASLPGLDEVIGTLVNAVFARRGASGYAAEVARAVERVVAERLLSLAAEAPMPQVRAIAELRLEGLRTRLEQRRKGADVASQAHARLLMEDIRRFLERPAGVTGMPALPKPPPGSPIGGGTIWDRGTVPRADCGR
jgi:hypothetical protein